MKQYQRTYIFLALFYCVSCATTPEPKFYLPLAVVSGTADITVSIEEKDTKEPVSSEESRDMALDAYQIFTIQESNKPDIPEKNYLSRIPLRDRFPAQKAADRTPAAGKQQFPTKLEKGEMLNFPIPPNAKAIVVVVNSKAEPVQFVCTGKLYELNQGESRFFHFW
ncbi:MAG: hypothetical protein ACTTH8_06775 [Treponema sp.]